jgi:hypothetical protein
MREAVSARLKSWRLLGSFLLKSANAVVGLVVTDRRDSALSRRPTSLYPEADDKPRQARQTAYWLPAAGRLH